MSATISRFNAPIQLRQTSTNTIEDASWVSKTIDQSSRTHEFEPIRLALYNTARGCRAQHARAEGPRSQELDIRSSSIRPTTPEKVAPISVYEQGNDGIIRLVIKETDGMSSEDTKSAGPVSKSRCKGHTRNTHSDDHISPKSCGRVVVETHSRIQDRDTVH